MRIKNYGGALLLGGVLALAGCAGSDGAQGPQGPKGDAGSIGPTGINGVTGGKLKLSIDSVVTAPVNGVNTTTLTFTVSPAANVCPGGVCDPSLSSAVIGTKTFYAQEYNAATNTYDTSKNFSFGNIKFKGFSADGNGAQYTATKANPPFTVETSPSAFVYAYVTGLAAYPAPAQGHYLLPTSVASASKVFGSIGYTSTANVAGCERCHGAPYSKHGYRQAAVGTGADKLPDFASCKVCHTDQRVGADGPWYVMQDDAANYDPNNWDTTKYAYTANIMNDVHNSHAFEFDYPQSMANCVTCHAGKLARVLTDANFKPSVCKSCHPVTGTNQDPDRAPAMMGIWTSMNLLTVHNAVIPLYGTLPDNACNVCHSANNTSGAKTFAQIHSGYSEQIYAAGSGIEPGPKFSASIVTTVVSATYDAPSYVATVTFSMLNLPANAIVKPVVVASLYGWNAKDFVISGHSSQFSDKTPNLEWSEGALVRGTTTPANTNRLQVTPSTASAGDTQWVAQIDLSTWAALINAGQVKRIEVSFLPNIGLDPTQASSSTNPMIAVAGKTQTVAVTATAANAKVAAAPKIVDPAKCAACHDALGVTFHGPNYGSAGVVACRMCHFVGAAGSHLELQSRSIDSYVHGLHRMQVLDPNNYNLTNKVQALRYNTHTEGLYPNFAGPLNCESCHSPGTYDVPDQSKSLPSLVSATKTVTGRTGIGTFGQELTGPGARACGGCHRAAFINEGDGAGLASFIQHTNTFSSNVTANLTDPMTLVTAAAYVQYLVGGSTTQVAAPAGAQLESCEICHATSGSQHQQLFNSWRNGTK